jgi:hypothetical protein
MTTRPPDFLEAYHLETGRRLELVPAFLAAYRRVTGSDDVSPRALSEAMGRGETAAEIFRVWQEIDERGRVTDA